MGEFWYVVKCFLGTVLLLGILQARVGSETLEKKANVWIETSQISSYVRDAAEGAIHFAEVGVSKSKNWIAEQQDAYSKNKK